MKYSINADSRFIIKNADEYKCQFNRLGDIIDLIELAQARLNIVFDPVDDNDIKLLHNQIKILEQKEIDYVVACKNLSTLYTVLIDYKIPAYLDCPISDWETFFNLLDWGVIDIWIDGALCFSADAIKKYAEHTYIRMCPHMSANAGFASVKKSNIQSAFIRPEDVDKYETFIDILDFRTNDIEMEKVLFDIYKRGYFHNNLKELVKQVHSDINNTLIPKDFAEMRLNCTQKCRIPFHSCHFCERMLLLTTTLRQYIKS